MFELSIACKYLLPKRRQLSVSIISLISVIVISLVVWLILVFFSVTKGLEKGWIEKLISMTAPVRITPTDAYYQSYFYQIDSFSHASDYSSFSIGEKKARSITDPYNAEVDEALPSEFPSPDLDSNGHLKNLVQLAFSSFEGIPSISPSEYELASANLRLNLVRPTASEPSQSTITQQVYLATDKDLKMNAQGYFPVKVPKNYREGGVVVGDKGSITYFAPTASSVQEQRLQVIVVGYYDPGIVPLGGKFLLAPSELVKTVRSSQQQEAALMTNGIHVHFDDLAQADGVKKQLERAFKEKGIDPYWKIETFREYDYAKDLLFQLSSEKNIFSLISGVIILVACSNIISMLIILVNQKKLEIGILRSMGASSSSIALIFGVCGLVMGFLGTVLGAGLAFLTLHYLNSILSLISSLQGYQAFNPLFYGDSMPNAMSFETLFGVVISTGIISIIAGLVPAIKASRMLPAHILRSE